MQRHLSRSSIGRLLLTVGLLLLLLLPADCLASLPCPRSDAAAVIEGLGVTPISTRTAERQFEVLARAPAVSACHLVQEIVVVRATTIRPDDYAAYAHEMHVIWCLRALRFLTNGLVFKATTRENPAGWDETRRDLLSPDSTKRVPFFSVWMSHDIVFVAPEDAQDDIIRQWEEWYQRRGATFPYKNATSVDDWYF